MKKKINWNKEKNILLKTERNIDFEKVAEIIMNGDIIDDIEHPDKLKYPNQRIFVIDIAHYIYLVPYIENEKEIFLTSSDSHTTIAYRSDA